MADRIIRAEDNGRPLLDVDGEPFEELVLDRVDALEELGETVAELAALERDWRFGHVIVDEAQDLTPMEWRMVARRAIGGSMTIVGDLAQRAAGPPGSWGDHLPETLEEAEFTELTVNYRSPVEVAEIASAILAELAPGLEAPRAIRSTGVEPEAVRVGSLVEELETEISRWRATLTAGRMAVIGHDVGLSSIDDVPVLTPIDAKGLEFDLVVVVEPARILDERHGLGELYVAVTRATHRLVVIHQRPLPGVLGSLR